MALWLILLLVVGLPTLCILLVSALALIRHLKMLTTAARRFREEIQPMLEEIQSDAMAAQERMQQAADRAAKLGDSIGR